MMDSVAEGNKKGTHIPVAQQQGAITIGAPAGKAASKRIKVRAAARRPDRRVLLPARRILSPAVLFLVTECALAFCLAGLSFLEGSRVVLRVLRVASISSLPHTHTHSLSLVIDCGSMSAEV